MLKNSLIGIFAAILVFAIGAAIYTTTDVQAAGGIAAPADGRGNGNGTGTSVIAIPASELSADEAAALLFMREEEKLARDVYTKLYEVWGLPTFQNIAAREQKHMDEIALLLTRYELADPAQTPGVFTDASLQNLYNTLVAQGSQSLADALKVGGAIEEIDINDLQNRLTATDNADIQQVYNNLMYGSYNHLRAFAGVYTTQTGTTYTAQYITDDLLNTILSTSPGYGNRGGQNGGVNATNSPIWTRGNGTRGGNR